MSNQSEEGSILCTPIGAKLWPSTSSRPTISTSANTTWRTAGTVWSVQNLRQLSLHGTCAADFALLNLPKGKSLGRSKPATNSSNEQAH